MTKPWKVGRHAKVGHCSLALLFNADSCSVGEWVLVCPVIRLVLGVTVFGCHYFLIWKTGRPKVVSLVVMLPTGCD